MPGYEGPPACKALFQAGQKGTWPGMGIEADVEDEPLLLLLRYPDASSHAVRLVLLWLYAERDEDEPRPRPLPVPPVPPSSSSSSLDAS